MEKNIFKPGEIVICVDDSVKNFLHYKTKPLKLIKNGECYKVLTHEYSKTITIVNNQGKVVSCSTRRFKSTRIHKLKKIVNRIKNKTYI